MDPATTQSAGHAALVEIKPTPSPRIAVLVVTWNRRDLVEQVLGSIARQEYPLRRLDVVVIDNASTDGTFEALQRRLHPETVVDNPTGQAHRPDFRARPAGECLGNTLGFGSLTIVRNAENLGGCGGFNTGLSYVEQALAGDRGTRMVAPDAGESSSRPEFVWLVDDDADLPPDALRRLAWAMETDPAIGIVGSRTVDLRDRRTTMETTIYQERSTGLLADEPDRDHPLRASHDAWVATVGGVRGKREFAGLREVDVVSACSMLARWSAVERVGFWDHRYFIYCDDADWCLRFRGAGHRVVLNLDAVVYHTPWHHKLTPARLYYAQRNLLWTIQKTTDAARLRGVLRVRAGALLRQSLGAGLCHRLEQAEIIRRSLDDAVVGRGGRLEAGAAARATLAEVGASLRGARGRAPTIAMVIQRPIALQWASGVRARLAEALGPGTPARWIELVRNDVPGAHEQSTPPGVERVVYAPHWRSRVRRQAPLLRRRADLLVIFDGACDVALMRAPRRTLHIDSSRLGEGTLEPGGRRAAFLFRWLGTAGRARAWAARARPSAPEGKYGGLPAQG